MAAAPAVTSTTSMSTATAVGHGKRSTGNRRR
jgi:hypothetical protein